VTESKYKDVVLLHSSVEQLHGLFVDLALIVNQQGEMLDQIEYHVKQAKEDVEEANVEIDKATKYLISLQTKRVCCAVVVFLIVALIVGLVTAGMQSQL
jgi:t-SNARE complex subunit (syntaxin)